MYFTQKKVEVFLKVNLLYPETTIFYDLYKNDDIIFGFMKTIIIIMVGNEK